jgi:glycerate 2-kinase
MMDPAPMGILVAPDKFKGTLTALEVADAICAGLDSDADRCPIADGGDGTAAVLLAALGGIWREARCHDALGEPIAGRFALLGSGEDAVVEVAEASGLARLSGRDPRPLEASSEGTGELIAAAIEAGARRVLVACGGSATTDAGLGALRRFDPRAAEIVCLCDVSDPFTGALRYAPQKGADADDLAALGERLERIATELPHDPRRLPFTGAAGGLAGGLWAHGARLVPGARHVLAAVDFDRRLASASAVITGEGALDATSLSGKAVGEVARRAATAGVACHAIVGRDKLGGPGRERFDSITEAGTATAIAAAARRLG